MTKSLIDLDDALLQRCQGVLGTRSKKDTVEVEAKSVRMLYGSDLNSAALMALLLPVIIRV